MIKYIDKPEENITVAVLEGTKYDAINKINKYMRNTNFCVSDKKYEMPSYFRVFLRCNPADVYSVEEGHRRAKKIILDNYYASMDKRINAFKNDVKHMNFMIKQNIQKYDGNIRK